ncbi:MAG: hypothetical protein M0Z46_12475 [Actinomycetota bacterium]|nr:hypothetical protein [Actinomycetota bacterium]
MMAVGEVEGVSEPASRIDPVGPSEIAGRLGVVKGTALAWCQRGVLPPPRWRASGIPIWNWVDVAAWAVETGRLVPGAAEAGSEVGEVELVGAGELAGRLDLTRHAVFRRVERGQMPPPRWRISEKPIWVWGEVADLPKRRRRRARKPSAGGSPT